MLALKDNLQKSHVNKQIVVVIIITVAKENIAGESKGDKS